MLTNRPATHEETLREVSRTHNKIRVHLRASYETIRWGKIVHIRAITRKPTVHADGRVTVNWKGETEVTGTVYENDGRKVAILFHAN